VELSWILIDAQDMLIHLPGPGMVVRRIAVVIHTHTHSKEAIIEVTVMPSFAKSIKKLGRKGIWELLGALQTCWHRLKTMLWYRLFFKAIGAHSVIRNPLLIANPNCIVLGSNVAIRDGVRLELVKRDGAASPELRIGNNVTIEQDFHLACCSKIVIGHNVSIAARCAVVDITHPFWKVDFSENVAGAILEGSHYVIIGQRVFLGLGVTVLPNVEIGEGAVIAPHSVVMSNLPPFCVAAGNPARVIRFWK
jgi:acetyltransferase-like isoleucine patch superfamily enzyme